jgi:arsenate reductase
MKATIYHNPKCSKSRETLGLLRDRGIELDVVEYLKTPPTKTTLRALLGKLDVPAREIVRASEEEFRASGLGHDADEDAILDLIVAHPRLLQRPIVELATRARIGRPPEQVLELFE